jgi:hypothetical protein
MLMDSPEDVALTSEETTQGGTLLQSYRRNASAGGGNLGGVKRG